MHHVPVWWLPIFSGNKCRTCHLPHLCILSTFTSFPFAFVLLRGWVFSEDFISIFIGSLRFHGTSFVNTPELSLHEANSEAHLPMKAEIIAGRRRTSSPLRSGPSHNIKIVVQSKDGRVRSQTKRFMRRCIKNKELCEVCSKPDCMRCSNCL